MLDSMSYQPCPSNEEASNILFNHFRNNKKQTIKYDQHEYEIHYMFFDEEDNENFTEIFKEFIKKYVDQYRTTHSQGSLTHWSIFECKDLIRSINQSLMDRLLKNHKEPETPHNTPRDGTIFIETIERNCYSLQYMFEMITYKKL